MVSISWVEARLETRLTKHTDGRDTGLPLRLRLTVLRSYCPLQLTEHTVVTHRTQPHRSQEVHDLKHT